MWKKISAVLACFLVLSILPNDAEANKKKAKTPKKPKTTATAKKSTTKTKSTYSVGDTGWKVRIAQQKLQVLGYKVDNTKGDFTTDTANELKKFQRSNKISASGKLDEKTYQKLMSVAFRKEGIKGVKGADIVKTASKYKGTPYRYGGTTPKGFDCSGYVQYVFKRHKANLTRTADTQGLEGIAVSKSQLKSGDLVFFAASKSSGITHGGIYAGNGNFWHSSSSRGIMLSSLSDSYWAPRYHSARRVLVSNGEVK